MNNLQDQLAKLKDLKNSRETLAYRYYNHQSLVILLKLIIDEINDMRTSLPENFYVTLANPKKLATQDIKRLSLLYKELIIYKCCQNHLNSLK